MRVIRAAAMGMCFGVRDAIAITEQIGDPASVTIYGELVHNENVNSRLAARGFHSHDEAERSVPATPAVMVTAHGISNGEMKSLSDAGKTVIDTTCPLVRRAHKTAVDLDKQGWHVVVAGKRGHVEVRGLTGDLSSCTIIERPEQALPLASARIAVVCQTTLQISAARAILAALQRCNPQSEVRLFNTICRPTRERQDAMEELLTRCDAVIIVGGHTSNNTRQLSNRAQAAGVPHLQIGSAQELDRKWLQQFNVIGLTAGTSTPDSIIDEVEQALLSVPAGNRQSPSMPAVAVSVGPYPAI